MNLKESKKLIAEYLMGDPSDKKLKKNLAKKYKISTRKVTSIVTGSPQTNTEIEKTMFEIPLAIEQKKIFDLKMALLDYFKNATDDANKEKKRYIHAPSMLPIVGEADKLQRLNSGTATSIVEDRTNNTKIDVAEILKELKTPDEKKAFLLRGIHTRKK